MLPFALQQEDGQLPDKTPDDAFLGCTKPPIQMALGKLMDMHRIQCQAGNDISKLVKGRIFGSRNAITIQRIPGYSGVNAVGFRLG